MPFDLSLDCFSDVPADERPTFTFRRLNGAEFIALSKARYEPKAESAEAYSQEIYDALKIGLVGWKNQHDPASNNGPVPFDPENLPKIIDAQEGLALIEKRIERGRLKGSELKN